MPLIRFLLQRSHSILMVVIIAGMVSGLGGVDFIAVINAALGRGLRSLKARVKPCW